MAPQAPAPTEPRPLISTADALKLLEVARGCLSCSTESAFRSLVSKVRELLPLHRAYAISARSDARRRLVVARCINVGFPEEFVREYAERRYFQVDPLLRNAVGADRVVHCADTAPGRPKHIASLCREFGVAGMSVYGARPLARDEKSCVLVVHGPPLVQDRRAAAILELIVPHLQLALSRAVDGGDAGTARVALSSREREVVRWLTEGKSSWEISVILGISQRTVGFHVGNILRKLGAMNRAQAVAIAARSGIVD